MNELLKEKSALEAGKSELLIRKREIETILISIKSLIRSSGRMASEKYRQLCADQTKHVKEVGAIDVQVLKIKQRLREIADLEYDYKCKNGTWMKEEFDEPATNQVSAKSIVTDLVTLRDEYKTFSNDATRISSMRQMAAEFSVKLSTIIRRACSQN